METPSKIKCDKCGKGIGKKGRFKDYYLSLTNHCLLEDGETVDYRANTIIDYKKNFCCFACLAKWVKDDIIHRKNLVSKEVEIFEERKYLREEKTKFLEGGEIKFLELEI